MRNLKFKSLLTIAASVLMMFACMIMVHAASGSVTFGSTSYTVTAGEEFNIGVYVKSDVNVAAYTFNLEYDASKMQYVSGADSAVSGKLSFAGYPNSNYKKYWLTFKALESGECTIKITNPYLGPSDTAHGDSLTVSKTGNSPITIKTGSSTGATGSCDLQSIWIEETGFYGFSANKTEYDITVDNEIDYLTVSAKAANASSTVEISDAKLKVGTNYIYITVKDQNGGSKKYTVIVRRKQATTTPTQPTEPTTTLPNDETTPSQPESTTPAGVDTAVSLYSYNDTPLYFCSSFDGIAIPAGFSQVGLRINDYEVNALTDASVSTILFYMADANGEDAALYVYETTKDSIYPYVEIKNSDFTYILDGGEEPVVPAGYEKCITDELTGSAQVVWYSEATPDFYLIYASCNGGDSALYQYDVKEKTIQRFNGMTGTGTSTGDNAGVTASPDVDKLNAEIAKLKNQNKSEMKIWIIIVIVLALLCVALLAGIIIILNRYREKMEYAPYEEDGDYYDDYEEDNAEDYDEEPATEKKTSFFNFSKPAAEEEQEEDDDEIEDDDFTFL
ncbi:MAG: cadherin-like beta sandwich domain-containing protein [Lachnospiraceae bacterium]|nr:cadherin-like beta sandwich domain-containing protein [Lachnospiraceae bacterium]